MKKIALLSFLMVFLFSCGQQAKKSETKSEDTPKEVVVMSVDQVLEQASDLAEKEIAVKGTVMHVCQQGGQRCFLMGSNEDITIRVEAGEKIGAFSQEQMGSELEITGVLKEVLTDADAHNPGAEHGEAEHEEDAETQDAHKVLAENQAAAERVFFIEGVTVKEL
ncbi:hypothetical protein [Maribellus mangrovi]|uniref:hypothetical protein n=1 Tax=Maribellus mangrovi TaxID=3133146 RepID=UPI0030EE87BC